MKFKKHLSRGLLLLSLILISFDGMSQFSKLRITINSADNLHLQEVEWMVSGTAHPTVDMTSNNQDGYTVSSVKAGTGAFRAYDGTTDKIYIGNDVPYEVTLELPSAITPNAVRIQKPSWSGLSDFTCEGYDGTSWVELAQVQNPDNWSGFGEFQLTLPQDNENPSVSISSPAEGATFTEGDDITITANASDNTGVEFVRFWNIDESSNWDHMAQDFTDPYSHTWTNVPAGNYKLHVRAEDAAGNTSDDEINVTINTYSSSQSAYNGPHNIPGQIEAEDYDEGGPGNAYNDYDATNNGGAYRTSEEVDIQSCGEGGYNVGWTRDGEWLEYSISSITAGTYDINMRIASNSSSPGDIVVKLGDGPDGTNFTTIGTISAEYTNGWQSYITKTIAGVSLSSASDKVLRLEYNGGSFNINWIEFVDSGSGEDTQAPSTPSGLNSSNISQTSVDLSWDASSDNVGVTGYDVFKDNNLEKSVSGTSTKISGLTASTSYSFKVRAKDTAGNLSAFSSSLDVTTKDPAVVDDKKLPSINLHWVKDYLPPILADAMITCRDWEGPESGSGAVSLNADGWPNEDAGAIVWHGYEHRSGTYRLIFEGQADVSWDWASGVTLQNKNYNSSTNMTTADLVFSSPQNAFRIKFTNTSGGVKNIKMMRPVAEGSSTFHGTDETVDRAMKSIISKFKVVRYMDPLNINSNPETTWSDRRLPGKQVNKSKYNPYAFANKPTGISWEYIIAISNETNTSPWICTPAMVDDDYVTKVAQMFKYGSNGTNPYTSTQSSPVWEPLNNDLEIYVEYSNEVWNSGSAFRQHHYNLDAAITEVSNDLSHPLNFDNVVTSTADVESKGYDFAKRRVAWKAAEISKIFRNTFGDSQMMSRIKPLFLWQISNSGINTWGLSGLNYTDAYYQQAENHTANYYFWGGGPAGYFSPDDAADITTVWDSKDMNPSVWAENKMEYDGRLNAAFGIKFVLYEGGPGFGDSLGGSGSTPVGEEAWNDSRIYNEMDEHHTAYNQKGGELFCYYVLHHDFRWTFLHEGTDDDNTYKMQYIEDMQLEDRAAVNVGHQVPATLNGGQFDAIKTGWKLNNSGQQNPDGPYKLVASSKEWISYRLLSSSESTYYITVDYKTSGTSELEIHAGGNLISSVSLPNTGGAVQSTSSFSFSMPANKLYAVRLRVAGSADVTIESVDISSLKNSSVSKNLDLSAYEVSNVMVYPNPVTSGNVNIILPEKDEIDALIQVYTLSGKCLKSIKTQTSINQLNITDLNEGVYLIKISDKEFNTVKKLVVQ